ncbi:MAG: hypothetical protein IPN44_11205 [Flavobacteriales bacterium]|nr:hypothetical protein [Flavobacteriales bacterium]
MRHTNIKFWALAGLLGCAMSSTAQVSLLTNNITGTGPYVGCDANSNQPLRVKTEANYNIDWYTAAIQRMRLNKKLTTTINGASAVADGFLLLSGQPDAFTNTSSKAPGP